MVTFDKTSLNYYPEVTSKFSSEQKKKKKQKTDGQILHDFHFRVSKSDVFRNTKNENRQQINLNLFFFLGGRKF